MKTLLWFKPASVRVILVVSCVVFVSTTMRVSVQAQPPKCQDIPLRVTLYENAVTDPATGSTTPSAIKSDGGGEYIDQVSADASIKVCSGTNDAVLNLSSSKRTFTFVFPNPINGSVIGAVPAWVPGSYAASGWINVRNITFSKQPFATQVGSTFSVSVDRSTYRLGFKGLSPNLPNAPNLDDPGRTAGDNTPLPSSSAIVYPTYPLTCGPGSMPSWLVRGTTPNYPGTVLEVATLHKQSPNGAETHEGQYSMPFEMNIEAMQCFHY
jgi:hypothetical protein